LNQAWTAIYAAQVCLKGQHHILDIVSTWKSDIGLTLKNSRTQIVAFMTFFKCRIIY